MSRINPLNPLFQFYDSPIKNTDVICVRFDRETFQFYDSPIKSTTRTTLSASVRRFNSMIVRLKVRYCEAVFYVHTRFNSMIVRLKVDVKGQKISIAHKFQFYDSPIKSPAWAVWCVQPAACFNSMIVRLKDFF